MPDQPVRPLSRHLRKGLLIGAAVGALAGHPLFMVAHHLHEHFGHQTPLAVTGTILHSFSLHAWPLTLFFILTGGLVGAALGRLHQRLEEHRLLYQARLRALVAEMSLVEEKERHRLATELHEQVGQILAMTRVKLGLLTIQTDPPLESSALQDLCEVKDQINQCIRFIRTLTGELSPPVLYELGFAAALQWLAREFGEQYGIKVEVQQRQVAWPPCDDSQILLFIMIRDLLTCVARQARAQRVQIALRQEQDLVHILVEHDGLAIRDIGDDPPGFALFSVRERLDRLGGTLEVRSPSGLGTAFVLKVPLCRDWHLTLPEPGN